MFLLLVHLSKGLHATFPEGVVRVDSDDLSHGHLVLLGLRVSVQEGFEGPLPTTLKQAVALETSLNDGLIFVQDA